MWWGRRQRPHRVPLFNKHVDYMKSVTAPAKPEPLATPCVSSQTHSDVNHAFIIYTFIKTRLTLNELREKQSLMCM